MSLGWTRKRCSLGSERHTDEGGRIKIEDIFLDPTSGTYKVVIRPKKSGTPTLEEGRAPVYVQDVISTLYYVRAQHLKIGQAIDVEVMNGTDVHELRFQVRRAEEIKKPSSDPFAVW